MLKDQCKKKPLSGAWNGILAIRLGLLRKTEARFSLALSRGCRCGLSVNPLGMAKKVETKGDLLLET